DIGCAACHIPTFVTGTHPALSLLSNQTIHPFTDLLLHDMGEGLADGRPDFGASGKEWRTAPLWGIGLVEAVNKHTRFLHDGRARSIEEAILWHGGEAEKSKEAYRNLDAPKRRQLLAFLNSL
ncbi:di-heme oxidoredictase family protein, partial [Sneathiella sp.]|uniref:di-heme oxidoredictase family protein n=1 Tax=Sneathiella sp. TaxID=1964365 RepID=UPI00261836D3